MSLAEPGLSGLAWSGDLPLPLIAALLVAVPVFVQAPWVRVAPMAAALFTLPLAALGVVLEQRASGRLRSLGVLLVGFAGSWLGGSLFWGCAACTPSGTCRSRPSPCRSPWPGFAAAGGWRPAST